MLKPGDNPAEKLSNLIFLRIEVNKNNVYAGEPILVKYKLYLSVLAQPSPGKEPAFNGCSITEFPSQTGPLTETLNGKTYSVITVRNMQVTPLDEGPLVLPEASINNVIEYVTTDQPYNVKSFSFVAVCAPVTINVKPLPEGKPANFSGLVGSVSITAKIDSNTIPANENADLTITIKGTGNISALTVPAINWPANIEHFDANDTQHSFTDTFPVSGDKIFSIPFIGKQEGSVVIPAIGFCYFDPIAAKYITIQSDSLPIKFTGPLPQEERPEIITEDITNRKYLWIVPCIGLVVAFVIIITGKKQRTEKKRVEAEKEKQKLLEQLKPQPVILAPPVNYTHRLQTLTSTWDDHQFFGKAKELLSGALRQKFALVAVQETGILAEMQLQNVDAVIYENARHIYKICNLCLYAPVIDEGERVLVMETLTLLVTQLEA